MDGHSGCTQYECPESQVGYKPTAAMGELLGGLVNDFLGEFPVTCSVSVLPPLHVHRLDRQLSRMALDEL